MAPAGHHHRGHRAEVRMAARQDERAVAMLKPDK